MANPVISSRASPSPRRSYQRRWPFSAYGIARPAFSVRGPRVLTRRRPERLVARAAEVPRGRPLFTRALMQPLEPVGPPRAPALGRVLQPLVGRLGIAFAGLVARALVVGRVHHCSDVAAGREHEARFRAQQLRASIAVLP